MNQQTCLYLYLPEDVRLVKNNPHNTESSATSINQKKKKKTIDVTLTSSIIAKEKSDQTGKSENYFWFFTTLIAFVIAFITYIIEFA